MPIDYLLSVMRNPRHTTAVRMDAAVKVAPYLHPKLSAIELGASNAPDVIEKEAGRRAQHIISGILREIDGAGTGLPPRGQR